MEKTILKNKEDYLDFICRQFGEEIRNHSFEKFCKAHGEPLDYPAFVWVDFKGDYIYDSLDLTHDICFKTIKDCLIEFIKIEKEIKLLFSL